MATGILRLLTLATLLFALPLAGCDNRADQVRKTYERYRNALAAFDGDTVVQVACKENIERYDKYVELIRTGNKAQIKELPIVQQVQVLLLRHVSTSAEMKDLDGRGLIKYAVSRGLLGSGDGDQVKLYDLKVGKESASARLEVVGYETEMFAEFALEEGVWKMDIASFERLRERQFKEVGQMNRHINQEDLVLNLVERIGKKPVDVGLWNPKR